MKIIKASDARQNFQDMIDTVYYKEEPTIVIKRKKPWVVIQPFSSLDEKMQKRIIKEIEKES
jgi:prevent-host-death family protein